MWHFPFKLFRPLLALLCLLTVSDAASLARRQFRNDHFWPSLDVKEWQVPERTKASEAFPVPTSSRCIVMVCCQYMIIYLALAAFRTYKEFSGLWLEEAEGYAMKSRMSVASHSRLEEGLRAAAQNMTYGPMLCVLFIACRMRVEFLSGGKGEPQAWVQACMYALTFSLFASALLVLVMPFFTSQPEENSGRRRTLCQYTNDIEMPERSQGVNILVFYALGVARYAILLGQYGGIAGVIVGTCTYLPPGETSLSQLPMPSPAVMCSLILTVVFFSTQLVIVACRSYVESDLFEVTEFPKIIGIMHAASTTCEFAPMLSILFLAARMRALQHDAQPQEWAQHCMYFSTAAMCMTTLLSIVAPWALGASVEVNQITKEASFKVPNPMIGNILLTVRYICMASFYGGVIGIVYSIFAFEAPAGAAATLPVSPTVQCVVNLTCQFFFVYLMMTLLVTVSEASGQKIQTEQWTLFLAIDATKATLVFAPMLSMLFVTTRMYAHVITDKKGAPQAWVQDGMFMATWSLWISFLMCFATGLIMDKVETDEDGNVVIKSSNQYVSIAATVIRYLSMLLLYGGVIMVVVGLFVMTPETANGRGSIPFISDVVRATPFGKPPPGPDAAQRWTAR